MYSAVNSRSGRTPHDHRAPPHTSDHAVWNRMLTLHAQVERELALALQRANGLGLSEFRSLEHLHHSEDGELRMQDLAERVGLEPSSVSRLVGRLEKPGFAYKDVCPSDRRGVYAVITDDGRRRYESARATYAEALSSTLNTLSATP
ncbi:MarR family transcriptional regulator, partial [Streptomyces sp. SID7803]|nr:MarR family transcriptional regulator [Streptomyces sp. SID7803]